MTKNVTMAIDADLLKKARKIAIEKNTTFTELIRIYLAQLVEQEETINNEVVSELDSLFDQSTAVVGDRYWKRDDLYER